MPNYRLKPITIEVYGLLSHSTFHQARCCAEDMHKSNPRGFAKPVIEGMFEFQWTEFVNEKKAELRGEMWGFNGEVLCFNGKKIYQSLDDLLEFANGTHEYEEYRTDELYEAIAEEEYNNYFLSNYKNSYVQMKVAIDSEEAGDFLIELYDDKCGETCENFRLLCTGEYGDDLHYLDTCFHRIVPNGWLQGGDIVSGSGNGGRSIYGDDEGFADETFQIKHNTRGMVGMANHGRHSNNSQFYITFQPAPWMNCKYVAIGRLLEGWKLLHKLEHLPTNNERPLAEVRIMSCGEFIPMQPHCAPFPDGKPKIAANIQRAGDLMQQREAEAAEQRQRLAAEEATVLEAAEKLQEEEKQQEKEEEKTQQEKEEVEEKTDEEKPQEQEDLEVEKSAIVDADEAKDGQDEEEKVPESVNKQEEEENVVS